MSWYCNVFIFSKVSFGLGILGAVGSCVVVCFYFLPFSKKDKNKYIFSRIVFFFARLFICSNDYWSRFVFYFSNTHRKHGTGNGNGNEKCNSPLVSYRTSLYDGDRNAIDDHSVLHGQEISHSQLENIIAHWLFLFVYCLSHSLCDLVGLRLLL